MNKLTERTYLDLVELDQLAHEKYGWPAPGSDGSFHRAIQQGEHGQETLVWVEMPDASDGWRDLVEDYGEQYAQAIGTMEQMIADGHLSDRSEFRILVWW